MYGITSEQIIKSAENLITNYGMKPFSAYSLVYEKSAEMAEVMERICETKQNMKERMDGIKKGI